METARTVSLLITVYNSLIVFFLSGSQTEIFYALQKRVSREKSYAWMNAQVKITGWHRQTRTLLHNRNI
ncbi:MAG TPA: hypothetical protein DEV98_06815 [Clostridiales bacterium]|nr:hypothetical protein [Clostridiales bacterium]